MAAAKREGAARAPQGGLRLPLAALALAAGLGLGLACGRGHRPYPLGAPLPSLPRAGSGPLLAEVPGPVRLAVALRDPLDAWRRLQSSPLAAALARSGLLRDLKALPWIERWEAARARLGELARRPLPGFEALLGGSGVVAFVEGDAGGPGGLLWIERVGPAANAARALAEALNAVHPSGRDVEIEERHGLSLREVRVGPGWRLDYYVLADRLALSDSLRVLERSLDLAIVPSGASAAGEEGLRDLEATAEAHGFAAVLDLSGAQLAGERPLATALLPGVRRLAVAGKVVTGDLDPALWAPGDEGLPAGAGLFSIEAAGLDLARAWAALRPPSPGPKEIERVLRDLDALAVRLGRGAALSFVPRPDGTLAPELDLRTKGALALALGPLLRDAFLPSPTAFEGELPGGGRLSCPGGADGPLCLASCPGWLRLAPTAKDLGASPCERSLRSVAPELLSLSLRPAEGSGPPLFWAGLRPGSGGTATGSWGAAAVTGSPDRALRSETGSAAGRGDGGEPDPNQRRAARTLAGRGDGGAPLGSPSVGATKPAGPDRSRGGGRGFAHNLLALDGGVR